MKNPFKNGTSASISMRTQFSNESRKFRNADEIELAVVPSAEQPIWCTDLSHVEYFDFKKVEIRDSDWHTYVVDMTPDSLSYSIDGVELHSEDISESSEASNPKYERGFGVNLGYYTPGWADGILGLDASVVPWELEVDYMEVSSNGEILWRDNFDTFDETRWTKSEDVNGFASSYFIPENVSIRDGSLVLALTSPIDERSKIEEYALAAEEVQKEYAAEIDRIRNP